MPELPEVEVVRRGLAAHTVGRQIEAVRLNGHRVARRHDGGPDDLIARLTGQVVREVRRRGKYLWMVLAESARSDVPADHALVIHLGMSGQMLVTDPERPAHRHQHATIDFADGGSQLRFVDQRTFGGLLLSDLVPDLRARRPELTSGVPAPVSHIACDPLEPAFDVEHVVDVVRRRRSGIKRALLDQTVVSGIGNIYADEALWRSQIHGECRCHDLHATDVRALIGHAAEVMTQALGAGGTSFDALYVNVNGASGYFDRSLDVYGRQGQPCRRCGATIRREQFMNRSSHFCPRCQIYPGHLG
ncbi:Formamidopyrimidine-DNA glycosylase 1 [Austwickia sp. TVS 96-490-7B]|uniref:bifunctional DNA-formamidopyrimidine glycosylase/DNA-(apurinic or apyrimidinic site) lyase n=1 Tax=Austwickia sp. TVS 96-490-7B TaxID=2830843 RepID=UPI001C5A1C5E|nr:bifunctional DNA-formamidopyrimidine glycosylase/DNA-(apurinic or apyrimidinic site) lyase [Austwickia sp. TVS 96-490-7B]MBW3085799.1 Formamidopyrimidine-DNA glycosylase 1 [Austwickia sp. TVS 96-490-7B]